MFTVAQLGALIRALILAAGSGLVSRGIIDEGTLQSAAGAVMVLISIGYEVWIKRNAGIVAAAASLPEVTRIKVTDQALKDAVADPTVKKVDAPGQAGGG